MQHLFRNILFFSILFLNVAVGAGDNTSNDLVERAIAAHGGEAVINTASLVMEWRFDDAQIYESRNPGPPWDKARRWQGHAVNFPQRQYAGKRFDDAGGYFWHTGRIVDSGGFHITFNHATRTYRDRSQSFESALGDLLRYSPVALLRWLSEHPDQAQAKGTREIDGRTFEILDVTMGNGVFTVLIDPQNARVYGVEHGFTDYDGQWVPLSLRFLDDKQFDKVRQPARIRVTMRDFTSRDATLERFERNTAISAFLQRPENYAEAKPEKEGVRDFRVEKLAEGVYFIGEGVMYQLFVEFDDFVVALDGTSGDVRKRITAIQELIPEKPIRYVLTSHHHNDHLHGLDEYTELGAKIIAVPRHVDTIKRYVAAQNGLQADIVTVEKALEIRDSGRVLQIFDIGPVPHTEHMLAAYLPKENILFQADIYVLGGTRNPLKPAMPNGKALLAAIRERELDVELIIDPHSPLIATLSDLETAAKNNAENTPRKKDAWLTDP